MTVYEWIVKYPGGSEWIVVDEFVDKAKALAAVAAARGCWGAEKLKFEVRQSWREDHNG